MTYLIYEQNNTDRVTSTRRVNDREEVVIYERAGENIKVMDEKALEKKRKLEKKSPSKVIVPLDRNPFILATGASEITLAVSFHNHQMTYCGQNHLKYM